MNNPRSHLIIFLWLVAIHSFLVGLGMIFMPISFVNYFGFAVEQWHFFLVQGGVFHLVMCVAYLFGVQQIDHSQVFIKFAIIAKFTATFFLIAYFVFIAQIPLILLSGIGDCLMGLGLIILLNRFQNTPN